MAVAWMQPGAFDHLELSVTKVKIEETVMDVGKQELFQKIIEESILFGTGKDIPVGLLNATVQANTALHEMHGSFKALKNIYPGTLYMSQDGKKFQNIGQAHDVKIETDYLPKVWSTSMIPIDEPTQGKIAGHDAILPLDEIKFALSAVDQMKVGVPDAFEYAPHWIGVQPNQDDDYIPHCPFCKSPAIMEGDGFAYGGGYGHYMSCDTEGCIWFYKELDHAWQPGKHDAQTLWLNAKPKYEEVLEQFHKHKVYDFSQANVQKCSFTLCANQASVQLNAPYCGFHAQGLQEQKNQEGLNKLLHDVLKMPDMEMCESGCGPATHCDPDGVPLCKACFVALGGIVSEDEVYSIEGGDEAHE